MERRAFLSSSASGVLLAGCSTIPGARGAVPPAPAACLPQVKVDAGRVIRTVAGLRPYRPAGFVVREEPLGGKRLVHNYGHGGTGITLSWGSSKLAIDLGLAGHSGPVAVAGAGIIGLSTARLAQDRGFPVTIYAEHLPPDTTSNIAGGQIFPASLYEPDAITPEWERQFLAAMDYSWRRFQLLIGDDYGVRWLPTYEPASSGVFAPYQPGVRTLSTAEVPFPAVDVPLRVYNTMYVEVGRYLRRITQDFLQAGGRFVIRRFEDPGQLDSLSESLVFNCTGLGSHDLFWDEQLIAKRGQLAILLPQPEVQYAYSIGASYMFPRPDGILLGGTLENDVWDSVTTPEAIARILSRHQALTARACIS